jgi:hypothetical protein
MSSGDEASDEAPDGNGADGDAPEVPEIPFDPQLRVPADVIDPNFRKAHPLFDAPRIIDDGDEVNSPETPLDGPDEEHQDKDQTGRSSVQTEPVEIPLSYTASSYNDDLPEWKRFTIPAIPDPDDREIQASLAAKFDIAVLLQEIRAGGL